MYYVLQVAPGTETKTETHILNTLPDSLYGQCFHPMRHMRKKFHGNWKDIHEKLLPGYIFITTDHIRELYQELKKVPMLTKLLGRSDGYFVPMNERETEWLEKLMGSSGSGTETAGRAAGDTGQKQHEVSLSQVCVDEGSNIRIISGPLANMDGRIKKINLHKRTAEVEVEFMNRITLIYLGIELLEKK